MKKTFSAILIFATFNAFSQLTLINKEYSPQDIVKRILLDSTENFNPKNIEYTGSPLALGVFECKMEYNKDYIKRGIILSTGLAAEAKGPNQVGWQTGITSMNFDSDLQALVTEKIYDASVLSFDFTATGDSLSFNFIFASEEYPEYIGQGVNDVFGFFVTDLADNKKYNIAHLPDGSSISVDNINHIKNPEYYLPNYLANAPGLDWRERPKEAELAYTFSFDGMTKMLHASMKTIPGHTYHIKIAIGD
ncbi:MAG TPA: choice-of-anchor L domain-containing protein, partial [Chitinophagales bacterium]